MLAFHLLFQRLLILLALFAFLFELLLQLLLLLLALLALQFLLLLQLLLFLQPWYLFADLLLLQALLILLALHPFLFLLILLVFLSCIHAVFLFFIVVWSELHPLYTLGREKPLFYAADFCFREAADLINKQPP